MVTGDGAVPEKPRRAPDSSHCIPYSIHGQVAHVPSTRRRSGKPCLIGWRPHRDRHRRLPTLSLIGRRPLVSSLLLTASRVYRWALAIYAMNAAHLGELLPLDDAAGDDDTATERRRLAPAQPPTTVLLSHPPSR